MKQSVKRITIAGATFNTVAFPNEAPAYMVKNFGSNSIYVSFDSSAETNELIEIASGYYQVIEASYFNNRVAKLGVSTIYIKGTANDEVEVQQLCFH